jgi:hypothetical protein
MTSEIAHLYGADYISDTAFSPLADNVVMLSYRRQPETISRAITVIKTRASRHDPTVRAFVIGPHGIMLDELPPITSKCSDAPIMVVTSARYSRTTWASGRSAYRSAASAKPAGRRNECTTRR